MGSARKWASFIKKPKSHSLWLLFFFQQQYHQFIFNLLFFFFLNRHVRIYCGQLSRKNSFTPDSYANRTFSERKAEKFRFQFPLDLYLQNFFIDGTTNNSIWIYINNMQFRVFFNVQFSMFAKQLKCKRNGVYYINRFRVL